MSVDPRMLASNGRVAHASLQGEVEAERFVEGRWMIVQQPIVNLTDTPRGSRNSQLLFGERFLTLETSDGFAFGICEKDGYVGYLPDTALVAPQEATHWVSAPATHLYEKPDFKSADRLSLLAFMPNPPPVSGLVTRT